MDPFFGFSSLPAWLAALLLLALTALAVLAPLYIRRRVSLERLVLNNEVAGFKYATLGVTYAVLLGFAVITVWEQYDTAEDRVQEESSVVAALFRLSQHQSERVRDAAQAALTTYVRAAVAEEWPAMAARRAESARVTQALVDLYSAYVDQPPANALEERLLDKSLDLLIRLNEIRVARLDAAEGSLPPVLGAALILGALLTVGFTLFFGAPNVAAQAAMTGIVCVMVLLVLFAAVMLNEPFSGDVRVSPEPLEQVLAQMADGAPQGTAAARP